MQCPTCHHENKPAARFCESCGTTLARRCPSCGEELATQARFCAACGTAVAAPLPREPVQDEHTGAAVAASVPDGERRQLSVLFCDLVGSTALSTQLDPEDYRALTAPYHRAATAVVERFDGHVAKYLGDGLLAYFGYPQAHENAVERAVRAGLAIVAAGQALNDRAPGPVPLHVRVGIHTGTSVIGVGAGGAPAEILGETRTIAARVQAAAEPDTVFMTAATHRLISGLFIVDDRGPQPF